MLTPHIIYCYNQEELLFVSMPLSFSCLFVCGRSDKAVLTSNKDVSNMTVQTRFLSNYIIERINVIGGPEENYLS
jgi:hypothetical protein